MPILCKCCNTDNAPMAYHRGYLICDDCVEKYGSYDAAVQIIFEKKNFASYVRGKKGFMPEIDPVKHIYEKLQQEGNKRK